MGKLLLDPMGLDPAIPLGRGDSSCFYVGALVPTWLVLVSPELNRVNPHPDRGLRPAPVFSLLAGGTNINHVNKPPKVEITGLLLDDDLLHLAAVTTLIFCILTTMMRWRSPSPSPSVGCRGDQTGEVGGRPKSAGLQASGMPVADCRSPPDLLRGESGPIMESMRVFFPRLVSAMRGSCFSRY